MCEECTDQLGQLPNHITDNIAHTAQIERTKIESLEETLYLQGNSKEACKRSGGNN